MIGVNAVLLEIFNGEKNGNDVTCNDDRWRTGVLVKLMIDIPVKRYCLNCMLISISLLMSIL